jgi:hypothetical protein
MVAALAWTACANGGAAYDPTVEPGAGAETGADVQKDGPGPEDSSPESSQRDDSSTQDANGVVGEASGEAAGDAIASDAEADAQADVEADADAETDAAMSDADAGDDGADAEMSDADAGDDGDASMSDAGAGDADAGDGQVVLCNGNNCAGCCDVNNVCQPGSSDDACGSFPPGAACQDCTSQSETCLFWIVAYVCL